MPTDASQLEHNQRKFAAPCCHDFCPLHYGYVNASKDSELHHLRATRPRLDASFLLFMFTLRIQVLCNVMLCRWITVSHCFEGTLVYLGFKICLSLLDISQLAVSNNLVLLDARNHPSTDGRITSNRIFAK
jgi:hypothetical protein